MNLSVLVLFCVSSLLVQGSTAQLYDPGLNLRGARTWWPAVAAFNSSSTNDSSKGLLIKGFASLGLSVIGYGSALVPIKHMEIGDGMFFQWVFCNTLSMWSLVVYIIQGCPSIWSFTLLGGVLFSIGNLTSIPIIKTIGLGKGYMIWSTFSILMAWATARFGWFGLDQQIAVNPTLNYIGTGLATVSALILFFVKTEMNGHAQTEETSPLLYNNASNQLDSLMDDYILSFNSGSNWIKRLSPMSKKIIGCSLATFAGLMFGCSYTPIIYIKNNSLKNDTNFPGASQKDLDYLFPYMTGISVCTSVVFFVYCMVTKNSPYLPSKCVLPAFFSASLQFVSHCAFFIASSCLGTIITYPIGCAGPSFVSLIWSVFFFKEIKGLKNFLILAAVLVTVLNGVILITLSKIDI